MVGRGIVNVHQEKILQQGHTKEVQGLPQVFTKVIHFYASVSYNLIVGGNYTFEGVK